jgi:hypothetical protein
MHHYVQATIEDILEQTVRAVELRDTLSLRKLSNYTIHSVSIYQDEYSISIAVILYALSKIIERHRYGETEKWTRIYEDFIQRLQKASNFLHKDRYAKYSNTMKQIFKKISKLDSQIALYIEEVIEKSKVNKGSRIYEHGISMARVAEILGVSEWELMNYVGKTKIIDSEEDISNIKVRLDYAREVFNIR